MAPSQNTEIPTEVSVLVHSIALPSSEGGELVRLPRQKAGWDWMSFFVRRLSAGESYSATTIGEEAGFVLLGGTCSVDWGRGPTRIGQRKHVFDGLPYCLYLPSGNSVTFKAETTCEIAECRVPSEARHEAKLIAPNDVVSSLRGGGNASRQIVDVMGTWISGR